MSIIFDAVTKQFGASTVALDSVTFLVNPGEFVVITGPSGSGKTTLMRLLIREYTPESGEVLFLDKPLSKLKSGQVPYHRRQIGVVFQDYKLLPELNVWENIALPLSIIGKDQDETESRVTDLLKLVGLESKAYLFPSQLSGGEAQRISIARALATGPSVIFADEPTGNLDAGASLDIIKLLRQINRLGTTVLLSTHDAIALEFLKAERRLSLENGKLTLDTHPRPLPNADTAGEPVEVTVTELETVESLSTKSHSAARQSDLAETERFAPRSSAATPSSRGTSVSAQTEQPFATKGTSWTGSEKKDTKKISEEPMVQVSAEEVEVILEAPIESEKTEETIDKDEKAAKKSSPKKPVTPPKPTK